MASIIHPPIPGFAKRSPGPINASGCVYGPRARRYRDDPEMGGESIFWTFGILRKAWIAGLVALLAACATPFPPPVDLAAHYGPLSPAPSAEELVQAEALTNVVYRARPVGDDFFATYPRNAMPNEVDGRVVLDCIAQPDGHLACAAGDDGQPDYDFERSALYLSTRFVLENQNRDGVPVAGRRISLTIRFTIK